jgi:hypothetical protein
MATLAPRLRRRLRRAAIVAAVFAGHLIVFLCFNPAGTPEKEAPPDAVAVQPLPIDVRPAERPAREPAAPRRRKRELARPAAATEARNTAPAAGAPSGTAPASPGVAASSGVVWSDTAGAVREALRTSVGCDVDGLKLTKVERERCLDDAAKLARKGRPIGPAADDPKRAKMLAEQEEDLRNRMKWKTGGYGEHGMANAALPPRPVGHQTSALDDPMELPVTRH